jgi:hypothetical protein
MASFAKFSKKWFLRLLILLIAILILLALVKDAYIKNLIEHRIKADIGMDVTIADLDFNLMSPVFRLDGLEMRNTEEFGGAIFVNIPELYMEYDLKALLRKELNLRFVRLNIQTLNVVKSKEGVSNVSMMYEWLREVYGDIELQFEVIETLEISLGHFSYRNMEEPEGIKEIEIGLGNETVKNVRSEKDLVPLFAKVIFKSGASRIGKIFSGIL